MAGIPGVAIIIENQHGEVLIQLRENKPSIEFANCWTLPGGRVETDETPYQAAIRELREETGLELPLVPWKVYQRRHQSRHFLIEQHVYAGRTNTSIEQLTLGEGVALRYITLDEITSLPIAYGFDSLLHEFFAEQSART